MQQKTYTKATLIRELAFSTGITQKTARFVLEALIHIAYREAAEGGFNLPGICRLDIVKRKERRAKNPQTGETLLIGAHDVLRARIARAAINAVTPRPDDLVTVIEPPDAEHLDDFSSAISFRCSKCQQEIEAPAEAVGVEAACPTCGHNVIVPKKSEPGTLHGPAQPASPPITPVTPAPPATPATGTTPPPPAPTPAATPPKSEKGQAGRTIRIDLSALGFGSAEDPSAPIVSKRMLSFFCPSCKQEIETPADMAGMDTNCPACGSGFEVPFFSTPGTLHGSDLEDNAPDTATLKDMRARTIRIELPDDL